MGIRSKKVLAAGIATFAVAGGGVAFAAAEWGSVVQTDGTIQACYGADGTVHVKETGADLTTCPEGEKRMSWNQRGMRGPTGPMGMQGPAYFTRVKTTDNATWKPAMTTIQTWNFSDGTVWLYVPDKDVRNCAATSQPVTHRAGAHAIRQQVDYKDWILFYTYVSGTRAHMDLDVILACWN